MTQEKWVRKISERSIILTTDLINLFYSAKFQEVKI